MENVSVSLQVGIFIWGFAMLLMAMVVCAANRKLWIDRMKEKCDEFQKQYDDLVKALDEEKEALAEKYKHVELENTALKSMQRNIPDTIRWYQNILAWYTQIDGEKINDIINEQVRRFHFADQPD